MNIVIGSEPFWISVEGKIKKIFAGAGPHSN